MDSVIRQAAGLDFEVVVVDNFSEDGSYQALAAYASSVPMQLVRRQCSRGVGREIAFELSRGDYVVTFDLDTVYNADWGRLLRWAIGNRIEFGLSSAYSQVHPRSALKAVGGWRDFQYWEDVDLWVRLANKGLYRTYPMISGDNRKRVPGRGRPEKTTRLYARIRDKVAVADWIPFRLYAGAYLVLLRQPRYLYHLGVFLPAYLAGRAKRWRMCRDDYDTSTLRDPAVEIDCHIVPRDDLIPARTPYVTAEGCQEALARGDVRFLPGTYD
jgi:glycosyltransferase involved in cell wall biosynthesis